jgi:levanase/fructan beta-fructosidase
VSAHTDGPGSFPYPETDYQEPNRGQFHFSTRGGWMNDVNAPLYYRGVYHLYYQHAPDSLEWDTMHWGHATSTDLVHWEQRPIALDPAIHPGDLWSGGGVVDIGNASGLKSGDHDPIIVYSGTNGVTIFVSLDGGDTFTPYDDGRTVVTPGGTSRDPKVFRDGEGWGMVVWSDEGGNGVDFYISANLLDWTFASRFGADWLFECPNIVRMPIDDGYRWVLHDAGGQYLVGDWDGTTFHTDWAEPQKINQTKTFAGAGYYAALTFENLPDDRIVSMAWQGENRGSIWTGNTSFPVEQQLRHTPDGLRVTSTPVREIALLREDSQHWSDLSVADSKQRFAAGRTYELQATVAVRDAARFVIRLRPAEDGTAGREIVYAAGTLDGASLPTQDGRLKLRVLVDHGQLDVFANDGEMYQSYNVAFDDLPGSTDVELEAVGSIEIESLTIHRLASIWKH